MSESEQKVTHYPLCFGCGVANDHGLRLDAVNVGDEVVVTCVPPAHAQGGPGIVHGGYVAAIVDEVMALTASALGGLPAMTRRVEIDYRAPVLVDAPLEVRARVAEDRGRKVTIELVAREPGQDAVKFEAKGIYIKVDIKAWAQPVDASQNVDVTQEEFGDGDPSNFFRWQMEMLKDRFDPARVSAPIEVSLTLTDVVPSRWRLSATDVGFTVEDAGDAPGGGARFSGKFKAWERFILRKLSLDELIDQGLVEVEGRDLLAALPMVFRSRTEQAERAQRGG